MTCVWLEIVMPRHFCQLARRFRHQILLYMFISLFPLNTAILWKDNTKNSPWTTYRGNTRICSWVPYNSCRFSCDLSLAMFMILNAFFYFSLRFCNECRCNLLKLTVCKQPERIGLTVSLHSASIRLDFTVLSLCHSAWHFTLFAGVWNIESHFTAVAKWNVNEKFKRNEMHIYRFEETTSFTSRERENERKSENLFAAI